MYTARPPRGRAPPTDLHHKAPPQQTIPRSPPPTDPRPLLQSCRTPPLPNPLGVPLQCLRSAHRAAADALSGSTDATPANDDVRRRDQGLLL
eukprot:CAMPEP_0174302062 /NCGR_PEP_ID=MMETSP0809-20121228/59419_1 /TAXON_ID=73025 ORGANISM="Eutreptiella gymnastica-like, Strain CCMP1594" /NCGR_SAMPLE_ID=MMETSP0809 /ASSEMBLY_ACC=CAM_ASM_000658 /LENGTH=91 /DNA_ID=CAMNT_0015407927 /DNA_START=636 /DNA_END=911 /DNA_ORIENTATION=+